MEDLFVNDLIEWIDESGSNVIERILWIDSNYSLAFVFDIQVKKGFPEPKTVSEIKEAIETGRALKLKNDPWARIVKDDWLTKTEKDYREKAWRIIASLVEQEPSIYYRSQRGALVKQVVEEYNLGRSQNKLIEKTVYEYLRRFWQRGKNPNAMLPDYANCGGKGKTKESGFKKRGRPRKYAQEDGIGFGINITDSDRKIFRLAITKFYNNVKHNSLQTAYKLMIKQYYAEEIIFDENRVKKSILIPPEQRPTFTQFKYWHQIEQEDIRKTITSRKGVKRYALEHRAITGTDRMETIGPGSRYQIDATIADVYLVSKYNRAWIIGRPVIYVIIDVFSRMIAGVYVGLEGPSWTGAMMALANAATSKVKFCREVGITISDTEWPCYHIPDAILGDRGELAGMTVETLIPNLNVRIENAASYRADWKGLVERHFRTIGGYVKPFLPGYIDTDFRQRGSRDYRLDSRLDLDQFTEIIIHLIRYHNNHHYLANYDREEMMIHDDVNPIPIELWKWGILNRSGRLRTFPEDIIKLNLMLDAIRSGDKEWMIKYKDIAPLDPTEYRNKCLSSLETRDLEEVRRLARKQQSSTYISATLRHVIVELMNLDVSPNQAKECAQSVVATLGEDAPVSSLIKEAYKLALQGSSVKSERGTNRKRKTKNLPTYQAHDIRLIVEQAQKNQTPACLDLKAAGIIKDPVQDFLKLTGIDFTKLPGFLSVQFMLSLCRIA
jgi:NACalpha-BTF3-like transcription factor